MIEPFTALAIGSTIAPLLKYLKEKKINQEYLENLNSKIIENLSVKRRSKEEYISDLQNQFEGGNLVLVLGAGVSKNYGLPNWQELLQKLLIEAFESQESESKKASSVLSSIFTKIFSPNPLIAARYLRQTHKNPQKPDQTTLDFERSIKETLYDEFEKVEENRLFREIKQFCVAPGNTPNLDSIITYNFDNLLELYLEESDIDIPFKPIYSTGMKPSSHELPIYHVHGYIPKSGKITSENKVKLSEDIYHQQYADVYSWANLIQLNKYRDKNCLFMGTSLTDPNLRRLLDIAKEQEGSTKEKHYIIRKHESKNDLKEMLTRILEEDEELYTQKREAQIPMETAIEKVVDIMENFKETDDFSFGIRTIWVDSYREIPDILGEIRNIASH